ncbi:MAG: GNAT family N-acetyltransferase [Chloroflexi bacterium RBG_16_50_11]|nr:MAG: GNAT family N-acetyltransferase [Chloroflexi bacterium RBG_16_50_11]
MNQVEKAKISDAPQIHKLINGFAEKGQMLARPLSEIYESIRDFFVIRDAGEVVACAALHVSWSDLAEIRSVAVAEDKQKKGLGAKLVAACLKEAKELGIETVFCFTYQPEFFKRQKFVDVDKKELPRKVWTDCFRCPRFPDCDEIALIYHA